MKETKTNHVRKLLYIVRQLITSQTRHDNNEKHEESIVQCTTIQYKTVSSSLTSAFISSLSDRYLQRKCGGLQVQKGRASTKFDPVRSASMKTNRNLMNQTPTTRIVTVTNVDQIERADW